MRISINDLLQSISPYIWRNQGNNTMGGHIFPSRGSAFDLGSAERPLRRVYADSLIGTYTSLDEKVASQSGGTPGYLSSVLSFSGDFSVSTSPSSMSVSMQNIFLRRDGSASLTGNLTVSPGVTIDGLDISAHYPDENAHHAKQHSLSDSAHHTGSLPWSWLSKTGSNLTHIETRQYTDLTARTHNITGGDHSVTGGANLDIIGQSGSGVLARLTPSADVSAGTSAILRSNAGALTVQQLIASTRLRSPLVDTASGNLTIQPAADIVLTPSVNVHLTDGKIFKNSGTFASGFAGSGFRIDQGVSYSGKTHAEFDNLTVRGTMRVYELLINQIRATNGSLFVSSVAKAETVTWESGLTYRIKAEGKSGTDYQPFAVNDLIRAQRVVLSSTPGGGATVYRCDMRVTAVSVFGDTLMFRADLVGGDEPFAGMEFVRFGNTSDSSRRGSIYLTSDDSNSPFIDVINDISSFSDWNTSGKIKMRIGKLTGITGIANEYGFIAGSNGYGASNSWLKVSTGGQEIHNIDYTSYSGSNLATMLPKTGGILIASDIESSWTNKSGVRWFYGGVTNQYTAYLDHYYIGAPTYEMKTRLYSWAGASTTIKNNSIVIKSQSTETSGSESYIIVDSAVSNSSYDEGYLGAGARFSHIYNTSVKESQIFAGTTSVLSVKHDGVSGSPSLTWPSSSYKIWGQYNHGSGSGLDADLLDGMNSGLSGNNVVLRTNGSGYLLLDNWLRVGLGNGLYTTGASATYLISASQGWTVRSGDSSSVLLKMETSGGTSRGYVSADTSAIGFMNTAGSTWLLKIDTSGSGAAEFIGNPVKFMNSSAENWIARATNTYIYSSAVGGSRGRIGAYDSGGSGTPLALTLNEYGGFVGIKCSDPQVELDIDGYSIRIRNNYTPSSSSASGVKGQICYDSAYLYVCVATNTWRRIAHSSW